VRHDGVRVAYQVVGDGPVDLLLVPGFISHLDLSWAMPSVTAMYRRLASFSRLILYDKAGTGISGQIAHVPTLEQRMEEALAVLDAAGSREAAVLGLSEGGLMSVLFAATYPERTRALALYGSFPCGRYDDDLPPELRAPAERLSGEMARVVDHWGEGWIAEGKRSWNLGFFERAAASGAMARAMVDVARGLDVRPALPVVQAPALLVHRADDPFPSGGSRWMAGRIPGARFAELAGDMHPLWRGDMDTVVDEIEAHVSDADAPLADGRRFTTVVRAAGDEPEAFSGPAEAIRRAHALARERGAGAGVWSDELGTAAEAAARLAAEAGPGEVLVSGSARNLVAGSGLRFTERGALDPASPGIERSPSDPALAVDPRAALTASERARLVLARHAPGAGRALSRVAARLRARG
jgi:pimeloyl-ACP methyl ester carboxylesterase